MKKRFFVYAFPVAFLLGCLRPSIAQELKIYGVEAAPSAYTLNGKFTGLATDIVEALRDSMSVTAPVEVVPGARATDYVEHNPNVLVFSYTKTPERENAGFHFLGPATSRSQTLWKKKGSTSTISSLADVKSQNLTVGGVLSDWRSKYLRDAGITVEDVATADLNLKKLMADRMPLMISSDFEMPAVAKLAGIDPAEVEPVFTFNQSSSYLMFSKDTDRATLDKWQSAYLALQKTDFFTKAADKWSKILGLNLKFTPDKGFYIPG